MRQPKMTVWDAGNDLCACVDYLGEKEEEAFKGGFTEHAKLIRSVRVRLSNYFNRNHKNTHSFGLGPTKARGK